MCGIAGYFNAHPSPVCLSMMLRAIKHRGPDDDGIWVDESHHLGLAHTRLSIIDLSSAGHQPMWSADRKLVVSFNGEIYNYKNLRAELKKLGFEFRTETDTEVLIAAYQAWGINCLARFEGMFAFALYDYTSLKLLLARDRFGEKPLYYFQRGQEIWFASELRALFASGEVPRKLNVARIPEWLALQTVHFPNSLVKDVYMLPPGGFLQVANEFVTEGSYLNNNPPNEYNDSLEEAKLAVQKLLIDSITSRLISDVPVGAFLSGGIDSTVLVGVASSFHSRFNTYTVAFDDKAFTDGRYAAIAAKKFNTSHHEIKLSYDEVLNEIPHALNAIDHPSADGVNSYLVSKAVRAAGIKVALSGLGGDELFGGYSSFGQIESMASLEKILKCVPMPLRRILADVMLAIDPSIRNRKRAAFLASDLKISSNYFLMRRFFFPDQIKKIVKDLEFLPIANPVDKGENLYFLLTLWEMQYYMHDVLLRDTDQMSMSHGLEVRCPFLDSKLVSYVRGLPDAFKRRGDINKPLLVNTMRDFIPDELVSRPKQGFSMPFDFWMRNQLKAFCEKRLKELDAYGIFKSSVIEETWVGFLANNKSLNWARVWMLVSLSVWLSNHGIEVEN